MLFESRSIIFSDEELTEALQPLLEDKGIGSISRINIGHDKAGEVTLTVNESDTDAVTLLTTKEIAPIILQHCINKKVPLPRNSFKELAMRGDHLALIVRLELSAT